MPALVVCFNFINLYLEAKIRKITISGVSFNVPDFSSIDEYNLWGDIQNGIWEPQTFKILKTLVGISDFVFEVGIDAAQTTLFTAEIAGGVIALDPIPWSVSNLNSCIDMNPSFRKKLLAVHGALSNTRGQTMFTKGSKLFDDVHFSVSDPKILVETYLINDIEEIFQNKITFINMDIEGGEYICLPAMKDWLILRKPKLLLSLHPGFLMKKRNKINILGYAARIIKQVKLFNTIRIFPYIYDVSNSKKISSLNLFKIKFLRGKEGKDLQILCAFKELSLTSINNSNI